MINVPTDLRWDLASKVGFDLNTNKALGRYYVHGISTGTLGLVYRWLETDVEVRNFTLPWERKVMALIMYNRHMNGSKIPGVRREAGMPYSNYAWQTIGTDSAARSAAFREVQTITMERWRNAITIIDNYKGANNV